MPCVRWGCGGHFRWLPARRSLGRNVRGSGGAPAALRRAGLGAAADGPGRAAVPLRPAGPVFTDRGVTYDFAGEERPFPLDLIPRVIDAVEWDLVARGVRQRVKALEAFLADVYGAGRVFADGV